MTPEEIKTLVEQEAERKFKMDVSTHAWNDPYRMDRQATQEKYNAQQKKRREIFIAGATFYEQSVLPKILEEKDEKPWEKLELQSQLLTFGYPYDENDNGRIERVLGWVKAREEEYKEQIQSLRSRLQDVNVEVLIEQNDHLQRKLSQLQSQMEERERKAFEAARESKAIYEDIHLNECRVYPTYESYLKSTTQYKQGESLKAIKELREIMGGHWDKFNTNEEINKELGRDSTNQSPETNH